MQPDRDGGDDPEAVADALELLQAFRKIRNPGVRRTVISLAHALRPEACVRPAFSPLAEEEIAPSPFRARSALSRGVYVALFIAALIGSAFVLELLDPAPMDVAASVFCRVLARSTAVRAPE